MSVLRLTLHIYDRENETRLVGCFYRSPVIIGRAIAGGLSLNAPSVSRHHGALIFTPGSLRYVDMGSRNGTRIDGLHVPPHVQIDILPRSTIDIGPFQLSMDLHVLASDAPLDRDATWPAEHPGPGPTTIPRLAPVLVLVPPPPGAERTRSPASLRRALQVVSVLADVLADFGEMVPDSNSPLRGSQDPEEIIAYLVGPDGDEHLHELREVLRDLVHRPSPHSTREGTS